MTYNDIIKKALELGLEEVEIYAVSSQGTTLKLMDGKLTSCNKKDTFGVSIRGLYNGKMGYVYTESLEDDDIDFLLKKLLENARSLTSTETEYIYDGKGEYQNVPEEQSDYFNHSLNEKVDLLAELESSTKAKDKRIVKVGYCQYLENASTTEIINSKGLNLKRSGSYFGAFVGALAMDGEDTSMGYSGDFQIEYDKLRKEKIINDASSDAVNALGAGSVATGSYPVVFRKDAATDLFSVFSSIFSGEAALKKLTILTDKVGKKIFGENVTIVDDPFVSKALIKIPFDDEGVPCYTKKIVENGVFNGLLHSQKTAAHFNTVSTGNGFKPGIQASVAVSPTNIYLQEGTLSKDEIIASVEYGIFITEINGLHAGHNPVSGAFNVQSSGFLVENGKVTKPITLFVTSGNFFEMMNDIQAIGNDIEPFSGCACPTIKVGKLSISGK